MQWLKTNYTEVWISSPLVPLVSFADSVRSIASTRLDMVLDNVPEPLADKLNEFDEIVSWYGANRPEFRAAIQTVHSKCNFLTALPDHAWHGHAGDFFLLQVGAPSGKLPVLLVEAAANRPSLVIHPFSGSESKNWPLPKYRELAAHLPMVEFADSKFDNLLDLARWMRGAHAYLGNDSGISHLAAAIGLPTRTLFGPTNPSIWAPRGVNTQFLRHQPLSELSVEVVLQFIHAADRTPAELG